MNWSEAQLAEYQARHRQRPAPLDDDEVPDEGLESKLQAKCLEYCKDHGFPVFHDRSRKKNTAGWPDMFIFVENGVVLVELKSADGRLRKEQKGLRQVLSWLGHPVHVCRSYVGFMRIMEEHGSHQSDVA